MSDSRDRIEKLVRGYPGAPLHWVEVFSQMGLSAEAVASFLDTAMLDRSSPLADAAAGVLREEVVQFSRSRLAAGRGVDEYGMKDEENIRLVVTPAEQTAIIAEIGHLCTPVFRAGSNGTYSSHAVLRAVSQACRAYMFRMIPPGARIAEIGAGIPSMLFRAVPAVAFAPRLNARDSIRVQWDVLKRMVQANRLGWYSDEARERVAMMADGRLPVHDAKVQDVDFRAEYLVSNDANYDIAFEDMPVIMEACGARAWFGKLNRAPRLVRGIRENRGETPSLGVVYEVDWAKDKVKFHHKGSPNFDYTHTVSDYAKYEEHTDYVFRGPGAYDYVYTKLPGSTRNILMFVCARVPKRRHYQNLPTFAPSGNAGKTRVKTIWAVGDELDGVPRSFVHREFVVETLAYEKLLEKRRAMDAMGNIGDTLRFCRSVRVRFWLAGVPVGVTERIHTSCVEGLAVAIEVEAAKRRLYANESYDRVMDAFREARKDKSILKRVVAEFMDRRNLLGKCVGSVVDSWFSMRTMMLEKLTEGLEDFDVYTERMPEYVEVVPVADDPLFSGGVQNSVSCLCVERSECHAALAGDLHEYDRNTVVSYLQYLSEQGDCPVCGGIDEVVERLGREVEVATASEEVVSETGEASDTSVSVVDSEVECSVGVHTEESSELAGSDASVSEDDSDVEEICRDDVSDATVEFDSGFAEPCVDNILINVGFDTVQEFLAVQRFRARAEFSEVKKDAEMLFSSTRFTEREVLRACTTRTKHVILEVKAGRIVRSIGYKHKSLSYIYDPRLGSLKPVRWPRKGEAALPTVKGVADGYVYASGALKVYNHLQIAQAVEEVVSMEGAVLRIDHVKFILGVPGAGKTWDAAKEMARLWDKGVRSMVYVSETGGSKESCLRYLVSRGLTQVEAGNVASTIDSYLMHRRKPARYLFVDEFPMAHAAKLYALVVATGAKVVYAYGDGKQIMYDSFQETIATPLKHVAMDSLGPGRLRWMCESHRLREAQCAMWLDEYPEIYPCSCCDHHEDAGPAFAVVRIGGVGDVAGMSGSRTLVFKQEEKEPLAGHLGLTCSLEDARAMPKGGLASVGEDQGSSHLDVDLVRLTVTYDPKESHHTPSLYNRKAYCLTATTRSSRKCVYHTASVERDELVKREPYCRDLVRLQCVRERRGLYA